MSRDNHPERTNRIYLVGLISMGVASAVIYLLGFVLLANLFQLYTIRHLDGRYIPTGDVNAVMRLILSFVVLGVLYLTAYIFAKHIRGKIGWVTVITGALVFPIILLFLAPYDANDIYDNISHGRILGVYNANPFQRVSADYPLDPFTPYVSWPTSPSAYGPLWENLAGKVAVLAGDGIVQNVIAFKLLPGIFELASVALVAIMLRKKAPRFALAGTLLFAWNPIVLYETWGNGHNDMAMVFWVILAAWAVINRHYTVGILALVDGALIKYIPLLLIPIVGLIALREIGDVRSRIKFVLVTALLSAVLVGLAFIPFWHGLNTLSITRREEMYTTSIPAAAYHILLLKIGAKAASSLVSKAALVLTVIFTLWQSYRAMRDDSWDRFPKAASLVLAFYLLVTVLWFQAWYTLWLVALAPLVIGTYTRWLAILFSFSALICKELIMGPIMYWPGRHPPQPWFDIWFAVGVMALPWLYSLYSLWRSRKIPQRSRVAAAQEIPSLER